MKINSARKVILMIDSSRSFNRGVLGGIAKYAHLHGLWSIDMNFWNMYDIGLPRIKSWLGEGIIAAGVYSRTIAKKITESGLPAITVEDELADHLAAHTKGADGIPTISADSYAVGSMAAEHFLERGFRHFAFCGVPNKNWSRLRKEGFRQRVKQAKCECHIYPEPDSKKDNVWEKERLGLADWLRGLPKPLGVMGCNDERSYELIEAAHIVDITVPEEIAVIGVDNDELLCNLPAPPLSSIALNVEKAGYEAAALLDRLMAGEKMAGQKIIVEPVGVVARKSTDILAISDPAVPAAIRFIREHVGDVIRVDDVVNATPLSRRLLERRFRESLGRSILKEIQRVHLESATEILLKTDLPISQVAQESGFSSATHLGVIFKQRMKMTPLAYRKAFRNGQI